MHALKFMLIILFIICLPDISGTCQTIPKQDIKDSTKVYRKIEQISKKGRFSKFVYFLIFKPLSNKPTQRKQKTPKAIQKVFTRYEGKIIRSINIETYDPFGYNINDTSIVPHGFLTTYGNKLHVKTRKFIIQNILLIKENDPFDSLYRSCAGSFVRRKR